MEDEVFEAEIMPESGNYVLNITLAATFAVSVIFLMLGTSIGQLVEVEEIRETPRNWWEVPIHERHKMTNLNLTQERSMLPIEGPYEAPEVDIH